MGVISYGDKTKIKELLEIVDDVEWDINDAIFLLKKSTQSIKKPNVVMPGIVYMMISRLKRFSPDGSDWG